MFMNEIKSMMYCFGDVRHPSTEAAILIEEVTHKQIIDLIRRANEITQLREGKCVGVEDIFFLLRKEKGKLKSLVRHLNFKEMASSSSNSQEEEPTAEQDLFHHPAVGGKKRLCFDFLNPVDLAGEFGMADIDEIQAERLEFQNVLTENMDQAQYMEYAECRQASFGKNAAKFKEWLNLGSLMQQGPGRGVTEILGYLCYDTVRELVELALLVKKDMEEVIFDQMADSSVGASHDLVPPSPIPPISSEKIAPHISPYAPGKSSRKREREDNDIGDNHTKQQVVSLGLQPVHIREALRRHNTATGPLIPCATHFSRLSFAQRTLCV
ncbi:hypothetical protein EMCRGX_G034913 [Ephydatia muelleri]